ncbi:MAG: beta-ketoacyl-[acyl-carrier-protein] synthase family protein [Planctomycetales bacterium]|nr:beta-ketoacyl-[acyl-carrier-protein] synthase family protein [Planctomycetales bacterium]
MNGSQDDNDRIVITGIGAISSVGNDRESVWRAVRHGVSGVRRLTGVPLIPDGMMLGAPVDIEPDEPGGLKVTALCLHAAEEAIRDAGNALAATAPERFGCAISGHIGDLDWIAEQVGRNDLIAPGKVPWVQQWLPNSTCARVATRYGLHGPRICHSTACASGLIDFLSAVRAIEDGQCDAALAGSAEAIHPLFAAGFRQMRVLAEHDDPQAACRPFDADRRGFVMGEGAAMFVIERLACARRRGAKIYAEVLGGRMLADAHHVTGLSAESDTLAHLITGTLRRSRLAPADIAYINAHGTGTQQNDVMETRGIRMALGSAAQRVCVSSIKSMLGHLVNAAGSVELAITALALRDGFVPPTLNLTNPDPECDLDCIPLVGRPIQFEHALKISVAFGGHLAAVALRRWDEAAAGRVGRAA